MLSARAIRQKLLNTDFHLKSIMKPLYVALGLVVIAFILVSIATEVQAQRYVPSATPWIGRSVLDFNPNCPWLSVGGSVEATGATKRYETDLGDNPCFPGQLKYKNAANQEFVRNDFCFGPGLSFLREYYFMPIGSAWNGDAKIHDYFCTNGCAVYAPSNMAYCMP